MTAVTLMTPTACGGDDDASSTTSPGIFAETPATSGVASSTADATVVATASSTAASPVPTTAAAATTPPTPPAPTTVALVTTDAGVIGDTLVLDDGSYGRLNGFVPNVEPVPDDVELQPGFVLAAADVEICAGAEGHTVNPEAWGLVLVDETVLVTPGRPYDLVAFYDLAPGTCVRGDVTYVVPQGAAAGAVFFDDLGSTAIWSVEGGRSPSTPLTPPVPVTSGSIGTPLALPDGGSVNVRTVVAGAAPVFADEPPPAGWQLVALEVEMCAGAEELDTEAFVVIASDNRAGDVSLFQDDSIDRDAGAPPGRCVTGRVLVDLPAAAVPSVVLYSSVGSPPLVWHV